MLLAASWKDEDLPILSTTIEDIEARRIDVIVLGPIVEYDGALPRLITDEILYNRPSFASDMRTSGIRRARPRAEPARCRHGRNLYLRLQFSLPQRSLRRIRQWRRAAAVRRRSLDREGTVKVARRLATSSWQHCWSTMRRAVRP